MTSVLDALTAGALDIIGVMDRDLIVRYVNRTAPGLTRQDVIGRSMRELIAPEDVELTHATFTRVLQTGIGARFEAMNRSNDEVFIWDIRVGPIHAGGVVIGLLAITSNVTEQRRAQADRDRFFSLSLDMLVVVSPSGCFKRVNPAFGATLGYDAAELVELPYIQLVHPDDRARSLETFDGALRGKPVTDFENRYRRKDGEYRVFSWRATADPITRDVYAVARDLTEQRRIEGQLRHAQKMEAVGQLAGGIAHDFNNLLQAILANTEHAMDSAPPPEVGDCLAEIEDAGRRAADLTKQLLAFSRGQPLSLVPVDLNQLLGGLVKMLRRLLPESISIDMIPGHDLASVNADTGQLEQVVVNLCVNARDAMERGGQLTIETSNVLINGRYCELHPWARPGRYVLLSVTDTGVGMTSEVRERAFEPFFTTKNIHQGTGLGLSTVYGIVRQHDGMIHVYSEPSQGTTFKIYLPACSRTVTESDDTIAALPPRGHETILVAEDEPRVRRVALQILQRAGYHTLAAANGAEAIRMLSERAEAVQLVLLDLVMPEMGGAETWAKMRALRPNLKVLFTSGYADQRYRRGLSGDIDVLEKPFRSEDLLARIRQALDA
jgi:two-component system cell cycle sensor histidine kinase/response regulator CckA